MRTLTLDWWEFHAAAKRALQHMSNVVTFDCATEREEGKWTRELVFNTHTEAAELAVAREFGWYLPPLRPDGSGGDVITPSGPLEVRWRAKDKRPLLFVKPTDPDDRHVFLVMGDLPTLALWGSIEAGQGKRVGRYVPEGSPPYYVVRPDQLTWRPEPG